VAAVREADWGDLDAIAALTRAIGWGDTFAGSAKRLWAENPAAAAGGPRVPGGWVLEVGGRVVGFLGNLAQQYHYRGQVLRAVTATNLVVAQEHRGQSLQLVMAFARQGGADLLLNTTASAQTSKIFQFLKFDRIPQPNYDRSSYWVLRPARFLTAGLRKKGYAAALSKVAGVALAPALRGEMWVRRRGPRAAPGRLAIRDVPGGEAGADFDDLWRRKLAEGPKLLALRDAATLRWHFAAAGRAQPPVLLGAYDGDRLAGYAAVIRRDAGHLGLRRAYLADLVAERDDPAVVRPLLAAAARRARADGADMLEAVGFPEHFQRLFAEIRPFTLMNESWPFLYKAARPELHRELAAADRWHACMYDGDGSV
jgi:hypothetical protein